MGSLNQNKLEVNEINELVEEFRSMFDYVEVFNLNELDERIEEISRRDSLSMNEGRLL